MCFTVETIWYREFRQYLVEGEFSTEPTVPTVLLPICAMASIYTRSNGYRSWKPEGNSSKPIDRHSDNSVINRVIPMQHLD
jgi:hypothetical protein